MISLWWLLQTFLIFTNAFAILNEERFLRRIGLGDASRNERSALKQSLVNILRSVRTILRLPLLFINLVVIVIVLVFG